MKINKVCWLIFLLIVFLAGIFAILSMSRLSPQSVEAMDTTPSAPSCPDMLIKTDNILLLYDSTKPIENGKNPIPFANLDDYIRHLEEERNNEVRCPVLYLQKENNTQGDYVYRIRPSPFDLQGGLPPSTPMNIPTDNISAMINQYYMGVSTATAAPQQTPSPSNIINVMDAGRETGGIYNTNQHAGFDPYGLYVGVYTNLDKIHDSTQDVPLSDNPMDSNWGGVIYTNQSVLSGKYAENDVHKPILFQPKGQYNPSLAGPMPPPTDIL
jgi:hypothetical protein